MSVDYEVVLVKGWVVPDDWEVPVEHEEFCYDQEHVLRSDEWCGGDTFLGVYTTLVSGAGDYEKFKPHELQETEDFLDKDPSFEDCLKIAEETGLCKENLGYYIILRVY